MIERLNILDQETGEKMTLNMALSQKCSVKRTLPRGTWEGLHDLVSINMNDYTEEREKVFYHGNCLFFFLVFFFKEKTMSYQSLMGLEFKLQMHL